MDVSGSSRSVNAPTAAGTKEASVSILAAALSLCSFAFIFRGRLTESLRLMDLPERLMSPATFFPRFLFAGYYDVILFVMVTVPFLALAIASGRHPRIQRATVVTFYGVATLLLIIHAINSRLVIFLGTPLNWQWLYYSDFLQSMDARKAILSEVTPRALLTAVAMLIGFVALNWLFRRLLRRFLARPSGRFVLPVGGALVAVYLSLAFWFLPMLHLNHARIANPVFAFVGSTLTQGAPMLASVQDPVTVDDYRSLGEVDGSSSAQKGELIPRSGSSAPAEQPIRNVVVFVFETTPAEYVETYGGTYPVTPELMKRRPNSVMFRNAYAHAPTTMTSMVTLVTGTYPMMSHRFLTTDHPDIGLSTISSELHDRGYRTAFFNSEDLDFEGGLKFLQRRDFDTIEDFRGIPCNKPMLMGGVEEMMATLTRRKYFDGVNDECAAEALNQWIARDATRPFFSVIWTMMTHQPYITDDHPVDYGVEDSSFNRYLNALHVGDRAFGEVMRMLDDTGLAQSTLVVAVGDHGESFGRHGFYGHGSSVYEEQLRVPLLLFNPRLFHGEENTGLSGLVDVPPTIMELLHLPIPNDWQGRSLFATERRPRLYFFSPWADQVFGYREGDMKYIYDATTGEYEIYDLAADPLEASNLIGHDPEAKDEILRRLAGWAQYQTRFIDAAGAERVEARK